MHANGSCNRSVEGEAGFQLVNSCLQGLKVPLQTASCSAADINLSTTQRCALLSLLHSLICVACLSSDGIPE